MASAPRPHLRIIVSGGSRGLGQALVSRLLDAGHCVATFSRAPSDFIVSLEAHPRFRYQALDAGRADDLRDFVRGTLRAWEGVDALVNNAGLARDGVLALMTDEAIDRMLEINLKAALCLARECVRPMLVQEHGNIINISSIIAERGFSGLSAYAATKAGLIGMTRSLAREVGARNIRVNAVAPGYLETEMSAGLSDPQRQQIVRRTPLGRLGTAADVVPVVEFLLSDASRFMTGQVLTVDGGASV